jgi:hypothetical protein
LQTRRKDTKTKAEEMTNNNNNNNNNPDNHEPFMSYISADVALINVKRATTTILHLNLKLQQE